MNLAEIPKGKKQNKKVACSHAMNCSIYVSIYLSIIYLSTHLSVCLSVYLCVYSSLFWDRMVIFFFISKTWMLIVNVTGYYFVPCLPFWTHWYSHPLRSHGSSVYLLWDTSITTTYSDNLNQWFEHHFSILAFLKLKLNCFFYDFFSCHSYVGCDIHQLLCLFNLWACSVQ